MNTSSLPQELMRNSLLLFENGVPIDDLHLRPEQKRRLARVQHVYWQWLRNPFLDVFSMFKQLVRGKYADTQSEWRAAQKDKMLFDFIVRSVTPEDRKVSEAQVRAVSKRLMKNGMATDNGRDMAEGAKILMKLDRLDQPESQQGELSKAVFLPPVVTTSAHEVDDTKEDIPDEQAQLIMRKYGAHIDEKRQAVENRVEVMMAKREAGIEDAEIVANTEEKEPVNTDME